MIHETEEQINNSLAKRQRILDEKWRTGDWSNEPKHRIKEQLAKNKKENKCLFEI